MGNAIPDAQLDAQLSLLSENATRVYGCSAEPANFAGIAAVALGNYDIDSTDFGAKENNPGSQGGRRMLFAAQAGNNATASGTCNHLAFVNQASSELLRVVTATNQVLTSGQAWQIGAFYLCAPDPVAYIAP